ncbi:MAG TPA: hypothetical protein VH396_14520 [Chitinophagaceae bacterium]|jgi:hypothetical protein
MNGRYKIVPLLLSITVLFFSVPINAAGKKNPILILGVPGHFDTYTGEILKAEGFNEFQIDSLTNVRFSLKYLKRFDIVILTEVLLTNEQKNILVSYVKDGGSLIAFRPDKKIAEILGIEDKRDTLTEAYIKIDTLSGTGKGLLRETLQFHGTADLYKLSGCTKIASLYTSATDSTNSPAVVMNNYGLGHAIAFTYNLPQSIAYTRQGNHLFAGQEKDSIKGIRAMDMFVNGWVDTSKNTFNQSDEQMHLLSHCIERLSKKPLPRFWYFPGTLNCLVTLTNDGEFRSEKDFEEQFKDIESKDAKMALYVLKVDQVSKASTDAWIKRGHEISGHPDDTKEAEHPTWDSMNNAISTKLSELNSRFGIPGMRTIVNHWFVWCGNNSDNKPDFTAQAKIEAAHHIGMDINYAHYDNNSIEPHFLGPLGQRQGNFNGSGLPLKFVDEAGEVINIYQLLNNVYDQQYMENKDSTGFYECFKGLMDRSINNEVYSYITIKAHNDEYFFSKTSLRKMLDYAKEKSIPVWAPARLLNFIQAKDDATFNNLKWKNNKLSFKIKSGITIEDKFTFMIPYLFSDKKIDEISINGTKYQKDLKQIKGTEYAFVTIKTGSAYSIVINYAE